MLRKNFCVIEGVDGVGKTTVLRRLSEVLMAEKFQFVLTKEPGGPHALCEEWDCASFDYPFGAMYKNFRELCVNNTQIPQLVKRALYKADSFYNWLSVIKPCIEDGIAVLSDRSWVSDIAYGTALTGISAEALLQFNIALVPDQQLLTRVIYLVCDEDVREARLAANIADEADKIGLDARRRICTAYDQTLEKYVKEYVVINTNQSLESVVNQAKEFVYSVNQS
jgi:dTMP kinase